MQIILMHCVTLFNLLNVNFLKQIVLIHALREDPYTLRV